MMNDRPKINVETEGGFKRIEALQAWYAIVDDRELKKSKFDPVKPLTRKEIYLA